MRSTIGIEVAAPPDALFRLARDVERWPAMLPHYVEVRILDRRSNGSLLARFVARRDVLPSVGLAIPVSWRAEYSSDPGTLELRFRHRSAATRGMHVTWRIETAASGCVVTIEHDFSPRIGPWATIVDRAFVRPIAGRTLATFKALAEAQAGSGELGPTNSLV